ncbi:hypothetical protein BDZ89DRAFT_1143298 [Hymenopellis radicata]|nr:hypothetical protein BDZ89DRAFT_1143298 [Hymenopellis radicata]
MDDSTSSLTTTTYPEFTKSKVAGKDGFEHKTFKGWNDVFDINASAPFFMVLAFSDLLVKA